MVTERHYQVVERQLKVVERQTQVAERRSGWIWSLILSRTVVRRDVDLLYRFYVLFYIYCCKSPKRRQ